MTQLPVEIVHLYRPARDRHILVRRRLDRYAPSCFVIADDRVLGNRGDPLRATIFARQDIRYPHPLLVRVMAAVIVLQAGVITVLVVVD